MPPPGVAYWGYPQDGVRSGGGAAGGRARPRGIGRREIGRGGVAGDRTGDAEHADGTGRYGARLVAGAAVDVPHEAGALHALFVGALGGGVVPDERVVGGRRVAGKRRGALEAVG